MAIPQEQDRVDLKVAYPFMQATIDTLRLQYSFIARPGKPVFKSAGVDYPKEIVTVSGITGEHVNGSVAVCFSQKVFIEIMECMHDEKYKNAPDEVIDELIQGAGEMVGIIIWQARKYLADKGIDIDRAVPVTVRGSGLSLTYRTTAPVLLLPFSSNVGPFNVELAIEREEDEEPEEFSAAI